LYISRLITQFMLKKYKPTPVDILAKRMIAVALDSSMGTRVIEGTDMLSN
jgi:hypothetical protein